MVLILDGVTQKSVDADCAFVKAGAGIFNSIPPGGYDKTSDLLACNI
jgi:hypothetical protein